MFGGAVDYAMLVKIYGADDKGQRRYSPAQFVSAEKPRWLATPILNTYQQAL